MLSKVLLDNDIIQLINNSNIPLHLKTLLISKNYISINDLIKLFQLNNHSNDQLKFKILSNLSLKFKKKPSIKKTSSFINHSNRLKNSLLEREYQILIKNKNLNESIYNKTSIINLDYINTIDNPNTTSPFKFNILAKEIKSQLVTIINIFVTVASVAYSVWYWTNTSSGLINTSYRVLLSLFFSFLILIAEVVVYNSYLRKINESKQIERKKKEIKKIIQSTVL
ncbi:Vph2p ASCRUDRAFT_75284 [Ascoidea rubescens DSM 1968]|uniref:Vacuolar ATPase assembly integral membrane protein VPH2 n=1 Tax=Ascoidea rubescens DSM 1968 TaxID=1344418 RepID=A0A1D2VKE6_9ASCO|nr:hypothetical protein ASCRUDRAFT_75284 [Ascoidea rubescens DSM 1968]ODV62065.1 hypothetical protein ASCRUDRAFT_75284 [Ascoidea rubescens DSM 1968]